MPPNYYQNNFYLTVFGRNLSVISLDPKSTRLISDIYEHLFTTENDDITLNYCVSFDVENKKFLILRDKNIVTTANTASDFIYYFEKDLTIEIQKIQKQYFYLHAAALKKNNQILLISGESGAGKSTTSWALLHHGYQYLSDELTPINLSSLTALPFPHAICLKSQPPKEYPLPTNSIQLDRTIHIPVQEEILAETTNNPVSHFFFIRHDDEIIDPTIMELSVSEATMSIYSNALNQLAHPNDGLNAAYELAQNTNSYKLRFSDVQDAIKLIDEVSQYLAE